MASSSRVQMMLLNSSRILVLVIDPQEVRRRFINEMKEMGSRHAKMVGGNLSRREVRK
jgi:hypothetical protein